MDSDKILTAITDLRRDNSERFDKVESSLRHVSDQNLRIETRVSNLEVRMGQSETQTEKLRVLVGKARHEAMASDHDIKISQSEVNAAITQRMTEAVGDLVSATAVQDTKIESLSRAVDEIKSQNASQSKTLGAVDRAQPKQLVVTVIAALAAIATGLAQMLQTIMHH